MIPMFPSSANANRTHIYNHITYFSFGDVIKKTPAIGNLKSAALVLEKD